MTKVTINKETTVKAEGIHNTKGCKEVVCLTTHKFYTSVLDAAELEGVDKSSVSKCCHDKMTAANGKKFCLLKDIDAHIDDIFAELRELAEKAAAYDAIIAKERAAREAEEKRQAELAKAEATYTKIGAEYDKLAAKLIEIQRKRSSAYETLVTLREQNEAYAM